MGPDEEIESPELHEYRLRARAWLAENVPLGTAGNLADASDERLERLAEYKALQQKLYAAGYAGFTFPVEYGGQGLTVEHDRVFREEAAAYDVPPTNFAVSINILGATLAEFGTDEQKIAHIPNILSVSSRSTAARSLAKSSSRMS